MLFRSAGGKLVPAQRPAELRAQVEANLAALGVERVGVVNLRRVDAAPGIIASGEQLVDLDDQLAELTALRAAGKIGGIGLSNVSAAQLRQARPAGIACVQNSYSVLDRAAEPVLDLCRAHAIAWVPFCPLGAGGVLGLPNVTADPAVTAIAAELGVTPAQVGLAWQLAHYDSTLLIPAPPAPATSRRTSPRARSSFPRRPWPPWTASLALVADVVRARCWSARSTIYSWSPTRPA